MSRKLYLAVIALASSLLTTGLDAATPKGYQLYPFPAVVVSSETITDKGIAENKLLSKEWRTLQKNNVEALNSKFVSAVTAEFSSQVVPKITKADRDRTLVVSLHIARARHYSVVKPNGTQDVYVPVTGSLYFTNPRTTEVVLALSNTVKPIQTLSSDDSDFEKKLAGLYQKGFDGLLADLVSQAKSRFLLTEIKTTISETYLGLGVTSIGTDGGLSAGDKLTSPTDGVPVTLLSCDANACIAKRSVGEPSLGASYVKLGTGKLNALQKPSAFVRVTSKTTQSLDAVWAQVFAENLGEKSPFNVVFFNPAFDYLITTISRDNDISRQDVERREPPELIVDIALDDPLSYKLPTNLSYKSSAGFVGRSTALVVDSNSSLIFSTSSLDVIEDEITQGIDFNAEDRAEISMKNSLISLAERLSAEYKPAVLQFAVKAQGDKYSTDDPGRVLLHKSKHMVYRGLRLQRSGQVTFVPLGYMRAVKGESSSKELTFAPPAISPQKFTVAEGDLLIVKNALSKSLSSDALIGSCGSAQNKGQIELQNVSDKVVGGISRAISLPFINQSSRSAVDFMFRGESGFREIAEKSEIDEVRPDFCIQSMQKIEAGEKICKNDVCQIPVSVKLAASLMKDGSSVVLKAVEQRVTTPGFNVSAGQEEQANVAKASAEKVVDQAVAALIELVKPAFTAAIQQQLSN